ncbi:MAG: SURF1 family protein [Tepidimonas sp.]|uniref:SURF1 family protein n=1 Tax=Tepidimonas sp. TaxID=2002775 RepID=UPI00298F2834|nr:SURF1 family protein [Tepidimonas sp.]MDW8337075.1 SURF1 family protein [Tepidimonas sp.]
MVTLVALLALGLTVALGVWQLGRAQLKRALLQQWQTQRALPALGWDELRDAAARGTLQTLHGRPVRLVGRWLPEATVLLDNRPWQGRAGFIAVTPLRAPHGAVAVLVQRGWLPRSAPGDSALPQLVTPADGEITVEGWLAPPPSRLLELGPAAPGLIRQNIDVAEVAAQWRLPLLQASVQQSGPEEHTADGMTLVRDWPVVAVAPEKHVGYAVQWFALAALIAGLYVWFQIVLPRRRGLAR